MSDTAAGRPLPGGAFRPQLRRARRRPGRVVPQAAPRSARSAHGPRRTEATGSCPATSRSSRRPGTTRLLVRAQQLRRRRALRRHPQDPDAPFHIPIEIDPPEFRKWRKLDQPDHRAGRHRPDGADRQALRHLVHRRHHRARRGRHDLGDRGAGDRHRRLARPADSRTGAATPRRFHAAARRASRAPSSTTPGRPGRPALPRGASRPEIIAARGGAHRTTSSATWSSSRSTTGRSPTTRSSRWSTCCSPAASARRRRWSATPWSGSTSTRTCARQLIDHPEKMDRAIEEFLRFFSPTQALARTVTKDIEFQGCPMKTGDRVLLAWASANRDPAAVRGPRRARHRALAQPAHGVRHRRAPMRRLAPRPGDGQRSCSARSSTGCATTSWTSTRSEPYPHQGTNNGYQRIPATFTPGHAAAAADADAPAATY